MAYECDRCGKRPVIGRNVRHKKGVAGGRWKKRAPKTRKISLPNLQPFRGILNGKKGLPAGRQGKWRLCTKCLKTVKKNLRAEKKVKKVEKKIQVDKVEKSSKKVKTAKKPSPKVVKKETKRVKK